MEEETMRKRGLALVIAILVAGLAADGATTSSGKKLRISIAVAQITDTYFQTMICGAKAEAKKLGVDFRYQGAQQYDAGQLIPIVNAIYQTKPDGFIIAPSDPRALIPPVKRFVDSKIPVVTTDLPLKNDRKYSLQSYISNNYLHGRLAGKAIIKLFPNPKKIVALGVDVSPGLIQTNDRVRGWYDAIKAAGGSVLKVAYTQDDPNKSNLAVEAALRGNPNLNAIMFIDGLTGDGGRTAIKQLGKVSTVKVAEFEGASNEQIRALKAGAIKALVGQEPYFMGSRAVLTLYRFLKTHTKPHYAVQKLGARILTKSNINLASSQPYILYGFKAKGCR
jgi:ribose transport system substrate-binding protein